MLVDSVCVAFYITHNIVYRKNTLWLTDDYESVLVYCNN